MGNSHQPPATRCLAGPHRNSATSGGWRWLLAIGKVVISQSMYWAGLGEWKSTPLSTCATGRHVPPWHLLHEPTRQGQMWMKEAEIQRRHPCDYYSPFLLRLLFDSQRTKVLLCPFRRTPTYLFPTLPIIFLLSP